MGSFWHYRFGIRSRNMIDCRRAYIGTKMELKPEAFKGKMFKVNERKIFLKKIKKILALFVWPWYYNTRFVGQAVKTPPSHGGNTGSIPVRTAKYLKPVHSWKHDVPAFSLYIFIWGRAIYEQLQLLYAFWSRQALLWCEGQRQLLRQQTEAVFPCILK